MKKIIIIGDIHGRDSWKKIVQANQDADLFIFLGDYFDSFDISPVIQKHNFKEILEFKKNNKEKVIILIGNHDFHYLSGSVKQYAGYQGLQRWDYQEILEDAIKNDLIQVCYIYNNFIFTHAGITKTWLKSYNISINNIENDLNYLLKGNRSPFEFCLGPNYSQNGEDITQGPLWVRPVSLKQDCLDNYIHIVGHTSSSDIDIDLTNRVIIVDTLHINKYLIITLDNYHPNYHIKNII